MKKAIIIVFLLITFLSPIKANAESDNVTLSNCVDSESARFIKGVLEVKVKFIGIQLENNV